MADDLKRPKGLYQGPGGIWFIDKFVNGRRIKRSTKSTDFDVAVAVMQREIEMLNHRLWGDAWDEKVDAMLQDPRSWLRRSALDLAYRGKKSGKGCRLDLNGLAALLRRSGGRCELTGIPFDLTRTTKGTTQPFHPSIDRADSAQGYSYGNCRVVCLCVNLCIRDWGEEVIHKIGRALVLRELKASVMTHLENLTPPNGESKKNGLERGNALSR